MFLPGLNQDLVEEINTKLEKFHSKMISTQPQPVTERILWQVAREHGPMSSFKWVLPPCLDDGGGGWNRT